MDWNLISGLRQTVREQRDRTVINRIGNKGIFIPFLTVSLRVGKQAT